jgi:hypothetical protein
MRAHRLLSVLWFAVAAVILTTQAIAQTPTFFQTPSYPGGYGIAVADFKDDGNLDIALSDYSPTGFGVVLLGNGDGTFRFGTNLYENGGIATADFNGDGIPDILIITNNSTDNIGYISVLLGKGDGTFRPAITMNAGAVLGQTRFAIADVNGDGNPDIVAEDQNGTNLFVYLGNGDGTFKALAPNPAIQGTLLSPAISTTTAQSTLFWGGATVVPLLEEMVTELFRTRLRSSAGA